DALIIGAGFSGLYQLHRLRQRDSRCASSSSRVAVPVPDPAQVGARLGTWVPTSRTSAVSCCTTSAYRSTWPSAGRAPRTATRIRAALMAEVRMKLYAHPFSSYCQKVLIALYENTTPFEFCMLAPDEPRTAAEHQALWPLKRMPVLVDDGRTVVES